MRPDLDRAVSCLVRCTRDIPIGNRVAPSDDTLLPYNPRPATFLRSAGALPEQTTWRRILVRNAATLDQSAHEPELGRPSLRERGLCAKGLLVARRLRLAKRAHAAANG